MTLSVMSNQSVHFGNPLSGHKVMQKQIDWLNTAGLPIQQTHVLTQKVETPGPDTFSATITTVMFGPHSFRQCSFLTLQLFHDHFTSPQIYQALRGLL